MKQMRIFQPLAKCPRPPMLSGLPSIRYRVFRSHSPINANVSRALFTLPQARRKPWAMPWITSVWTGTPAATNFAAMASPSVGEESKPTRQPQGSIECRRQFVARAAHPRAARIPLVESALRTHCSAKPRSVLSFRNLVESYADAGISGARDVTEPLAVGYSNTL
jgi:hypothetical protein